MPRSSQPVEARSRRHPLHDVWRGSRSTLLAALLLAGPWASDAQDLPLKREIPGLEPFRCPAPSSDASPSPEARRQAASLGESATQAVILGDRERARDLLARATELDPTAADLAFRYARVLDEMGEGSDALIHYCRTVALDADQVDASDARARIRELVAAERPDLAPAAIASFRSGVSRADAGRLEAALQSFHRAVEEAPEWAEAVYDRGVVYARLDRRDEAVADLRQYLRLRPQATDAMLVSERIGQLQRTATGPSPGTALTLGVLLPGMGQFYSGRTLGGLTVLSLVGGSVAAALLIEEVEVTCRTDLGPDGACPDGQVLDEEVTRPYLARGLGAAALVSVVGAVEAFLRLRNRRGPDGGLITAGVGSARLGALGLAPSPSGVDVRLVHLAF